MVQFKYMKNKSNNEIRDAAIRAYLNRHIDTSRWTEQTLSINMIKVLQKIIVGVSEFQCPIKLIEYCNNFVQLYGNAVGHQIKTSLQEVVGNTTMQEVINHPNGPKIFSRIMEELGPLPSSGYYDMDEAKKKVEAILGEDFNSD